MTVKREKAGFTTFWRGFEQCITSEPSSATVFNQYLDCNDKVDLPEAPSIRRANLKNYMENAMRTASVLVVGEAAGPWGCRFSGVPFTGERQLLDPSFPLSGQRSSKAVPALPIRKAPPFISKTVMLPHRTRFLVWDAFPLHSHNPGDLLSVRNPTKRETYRFLKALCIIKAYMKPGCIVAVGRKADEQLGALETAHEYVRHPSRGGKAAFTAGMERIFNA
jgi:hypothetical protein